ncbi:hypothetical protein HCBG_00959 [Histoplasma capsulatum G186AR]|uniref:Uncharacterized protein n=1 Tax=Ajellomyces capsulatus (strain G186AR / H82 / ATCC MYA-2454 / RMSCC 2432) TaxID=447093 RepID=C0NCW3_AJECG|nr:uncharacterized protein HCBG_00959 [Histoplasma capsulatum G186AR]EEH11504.1 hypothetical protein HCBG_00959 [Histoplasma capsulatum G186AR]
MFATRPLRMQVTRPLLEGKPECSHHLPAPTNPEEDSSRITPACVALGAGIYSSIKKFRTDKTLRLSRPKPEDIQH